MRDVLQSRLAFWAVKDEDGIKILLQWERSIFYTSRFLFISSTSAEISE